MEIARECIRKFKNTITNRKFWRIQWLNLIYVVKYTMKFRLIIIAYSLSMSYLYVELTNNSNGLLTNVQSEAIVSACISIFFLSRHVWLFISLGKLVMPNSGELDRVKRWNDVFKQLLFVVLMTGSKYLKTDVIFSNTTVEAIPNDMIASGVSAIFCFLTMSFCIRQFWKRLDKQMHISDFTTNESLNTDVCSRKVGFSSDWNSFLRVIETGVTYRNNQNGNLFLVAPNKYSQTSGCEAELQVSVALKYSMITERLTRLNAPMVITHGM